MHTYWIVYMIDGGTMATTGYQHETPLTHPDHVRDIENLLSARNGGKSCLVTNFIRFDQPVEEPAT